MTDTLYGLTEAEARTIVSSLNFLFEMALEHDLPLRSEEVAIYDKLNGHLEILANQRALGGEVPADAAPTSLVTEKQLELAGAGSGPQEHIRNLPTPPSNPHTEEDTYAPNIVE